VSLDEPMFCAFAALYVLGLAVAVFVGWMIWL
jgi:hypothetical protein